MLPLTSVAGQIMNGRRFNSVRFDGLTLRRGENSPEFPGQRRLFGFGFVNFCASVLAQHKDRQGIFAGIWVPVGTPEQMADYLGRDDVRRALIRAGFRS